MSIENKSKFSRYSQWSGRGSGIIDYMERFETNNPTVESSRGLELQSKVDRKKSDRISSTQRRNNNKSYKNKRK